MQKTNLVIDNVIKQLNIDIKPQIAVVLGTRLTGFLDYISNKSYINFSDIPEFPKPTSIGHNGRFVLGYLKDIPIIVSDGRYHYYEGYTLNNVVLPIRVMQKLGAKILIETNISGGINERFNVGDIMIINDHVNLLMPSPLIGLLPIKREERFVDMHDSYDKELRDIIKQSAQELNISIKEGVYFQVSGPNYETPAEVKTLKILGADAVGMSTACEVIVAKQLEMKVCGLSYISNIAAGLKGSDMSRKEILEIGEKKSKTLYELLVKIIENLK